MSFRKAEEYYRLPTQKWTDDNAKQLQKLACEKGELYALFGGTHTKGKSVTPINTEEERSRLLEYFPTIEDFNKYMQFNSYHLHLKTKIKVPVPEGWMKNNDGSKKKTGDYPRFRRYGDKAGKEILFLRAQAP